MHLLTKNDCLKGLARKVRFSQRKRCYLVSLAVAALVVYFVYKNITSSFHCYDSGVEWKINKFCKRYKNVGSSGYMCSDLCGNSNVYWDFRCPDPPLELHHPNRFQTKKLDTSLNIIQAVPNENYEKLFWVDSYYRKEHYPTETEYENIVKRYISNKYNMDIPFDKMRTLLRLGHKHRELFFHQSMRDSWNLVQNHEYVMLNMYDEKDLFPYIAENCGEMFVTEYLNAVEFVEDQRYGSHIDLDRWRYHIKIAVLILDYVAELEQHELQMCHVDLRRFGINNNRLKYDDVRYLFPEYTINRKISSGTQCASDDDCRFMFCQSECNREKQRCESTVLNNNVQIVCEKIFLGSSGYPGILITHKTPDRLKELLERCARPVKDRDVARARPRGTSEELKKLLYNELTNIYEKLAAINAP
ncbi:hypothetical protein pipiens_006926 [Culex pipiens pipiens]|uniref:FAM69 N-terminal domain-containing protein n=1 Tax=Culex pipiens pipiens TaxID=38569 RepID=A0ABD1DMT5_CULPP